MSQRQDSLADQMRDVMKAAVDMGCYDAHEWLVRNFEEPPEPEPDPELEALIDSGLTEREVGHMILMAMRDYGAKMVDGEMLTSLRPPWATS
jgi:hypothetical protein